MKRVLLSVVLALLVVGITVAGCAAPSPSAAPSTSAPAAAKNLDFGILTPLTGPSADLGTSMKNAILMAIEDQNKQGGVTIGGQNYTVNPLVRDSKMDLVVAKNIAEELVYDKGVKVIAGPFLADAVGAQTVTEKNKVIMFALVPLTSNMSGPEKPYSFFYNGSTPMLMNTGAAYIHHFYPEAKTVATIVPDLPHVPQFADAMQMMVKRYGYQWLGYEKFPIDTNDFMPFVARIMAKNPEIVDMSASGADIGAKSALIVKQLRTAGFKGIIWMPAPAPPGVLEQMVPDSDRYKIVTNDVNWESPIVSTAYRDLCRRYLQDFKATPLDIVGQLYNVVKPFLEFLNTQDAMDTTAWVEGFAKYHWQGLFGHEAWWVGKPIYNADRMAMRPNWASEYINGKLETRWEPPLPLDIMTGTPTGHEVLLRAFEESAGKTVDVVIDQEVANVTPKMWTWWFSGNLERYYRLWLPTNHFSAKMTVPEGSGGVPVVQIEEMIGPYYTQFDCHIIPGGIGGGARGLEFLTPDGKIYGTLTHDVTPSDNGIKIHSVFTFPAETDKGLLDATYEHCKIEMQDLTRFLPALYNEKNK